MVEFSALSADIVFIPTKIIDFEKCSKPHSSDLRDWKIFLWLSSPQIYPWLGFLAKNCVFENNLRKTNNVFIQSISDSSFRGHEEIVMPVCHALNKTDFKYISWSVRSNCVTDTPTIVTFSKGWYKWWNAQKYLFREIRTSYGNWLVFICNFS